VTSVTRFGERTAHGAASFRCAACGEAAGVVKVVRTGTSVDMGPPAGLQSSAHDGLVVDYFLGTTWLAASAAALDAVQAIIDGGNADPVSLRQLNWELAPFYCPDCELNYCRDDWSTQVLTDDGFYDCTIGTCPNGHRHMVDDLSPCTCRRRSRARSPRPRLHERAVRDAAGPALDPLGPGRGDAIRLRLARYRKGRRDLLRL
jgi:hypothetical protein